MAHTHLFEVAYKTGVTDPAGLGLKNDITHLGLGHVKNVSSSQLYRIFGQLSVEDRSRIAQELLCDPILNECKEDPSPRLRDPLPKGRGPGLAFSLQGEGGRRPDEGKRSIAIDVWYKQGVTDVVGESVQKGIRDLNIGSVKEVRTGTRYCLDGITKREVAEKIALALLVNPLVHESTIHAD
jgi:phosphoribosylformylglycinamidine (FGAM) synthase PurS component